MEDDATDLRPGVSESNPSSWQILRSETVLDSPWLRVHRQQVRAQNGYEIPEYYVLDAPNIVVLLALTDTGEVLLVHQYRHGVARAVLELPAGLIESTDATPESAARRELLEETGYCATHVELLGQLFPSPARQSNVTHCYLALGCRQAAQPGGDASETIELRLLPVGKIRPLARKGHLASQTSLACLFLGLERLEELGVG